MSGSGSGRVQRFVVAATLALVAAAATTAATAAASATVSGTGGRSTADHTKFEELKGPFPNGEAVTQACLGCHTEAAQQVMATRHWTWEATHPTTGQQLGKKTMLNSFCIGNKSNEAFCQSCHVGYGWKDGRFDFQAQTRVDCLVCHHAGGYRKPPGLAGEVPATRIELPPGSGQFVGPIDLAKVAQGVGATSLATCGSCHFYGGGGDGVKHGDLDSSLTRADRNLDVHLAAKDKGGAGFTCTTCHETEAHRIPGSLSAMTAADPHGAALRGAGQGRNLASCTSCHGDKPHQESLLAVQVLNRHTDVLACQACHVPHFARGGVPTKTGWDWSTAGQLSPEGKPFQRKDAQGHVVYDSKKGSFTVGEKLVPDYVWFDGTVSYTLQGDRIDPTGLVRINRFHGTPGDPGSRIWPVKRFTGQQPYDKQHLQLLVVHTAGTDDAAFWKHFDWPKALQAGAEASGQPFSGEYGFVKTEMLWPLTHMVAPAAQSVKCGHCHSAQGRMAGVEGVYVPGRDNNPWIDRLGWLAVAGALAGVLLHAGARVLSARRKGRHHG
jgi:octaheme c-type cytochrome (tetrathionate reductase family)